MRGVSAGAAWLSVVGVARWLDIEAFVAGSLVIAELAGQPSFFHDMVDILQMFPGHSIMEVLVRGIT